MKYIDVEKLIDMIDNSIAYCQINYSDDYALGFEQSLREVKNFITHLQSEEEQPETDIEKEMDKLVSLEYVNQPDDEWDMCIARHFYELGKNARKEG